MGKRRGMVGGIVLAVIIVVAVFILAMCSTRVPAGYVAVQYNMSGGVMDDVLTQGWHLTSPTVNTTLYTVGIEQSYLTEGKNGDSKDDESFSASSSEGKEIIIDLTFTYQYQVDKVTEVFTQFKGQSGEEVRDSFIKPNIISWTKEVVAQYAVADIIGAERANVNTALTNYLADKFDAYGITITNASLINVTVDDDTMEAINAKIQAQQDAETQSIKNQTAIEKAEAEATVKLTEAQAEADALLIEAEAEAEANKMLEESLSSNVLTQHYIDQWDGVLPTYVGSGGDSLLLNLNPSSDSESTDTDTSE